MNISFISSGISSPFYFFCWLVARDNLLLEMGREVEGVVRDDRYYMAEKSNRDVQVHEITYEYTVDHQLIVSRQRGGEWWCSGLKSGSEVQLLYLPRKPSRSGLNPTVYGDRNLY